MAREAVVPRATYRLQLHAGFTLDDAAAIVPYLARLGVSHVFLSPVLQATPGSTHGYDVVDPTRVDADRGGEAGRRRLLDAARASGLGVVVDVVPNHMSVADEANRWWCDVLEHGAASRFAAVFDVDREGAGRGPMLLPVLGDGVGRVIEAGQLALVRRGADVVVTYADRAFPLCPASVGRLLQGPALATGDDRLAFVADALQSLPDGDDATGRRRRERDHAVLKSLLAERLDVASIAAAVDAHLAAVSSDPTALDQVLLAQAYRLASWRTGRRELAYRRFFDILDLVGVRVDDPEVFALTHDLLLRWADEGDVDGWRIDHPDGIRDPEAYLELLRARSPGLWIVVEKILAPGEALPASWPVQGTTGYDFLRLADHLFVAPEARPVIDALWREVGGEDAPFATFARRGRLQVLDDALGSELSRLVGLLGKVTAAHVRHRDHTTDDLRAVLREVLAAMPVYRTYVRPGRPATAADRAVVATAIAQAAATLPELDPELLTFLGAVLVLDVDGDHEHAFVAAWQQISGAVMAKGVEDTAFYVDTRFVALDEVGGAPGAFGLDVDGFHAALQTAAVERPVSVLASSTHDTKRGEDVRARLTVLTEVPDAWADAVRRWRAHTAPWRDPRVDGPTELLVLQTLVGASPLSTERLVDYVRKAIREAKVATSWTQPDAAYEDAVLGFAAALQEDEAFVADLSAFVACIEPAAHVASLARTLIRLTAPGVPDLYQGTELWEHSLVDPDNRRPVDFAARAALLDRLDRAGDVAAEALAGSADGLPKLHVVRTALWVRASRPAAFAPGAAYTPLAVVGAAAARVLAYTRGEDVVVVVPVRTVGLPEASRDARLTLDRDHRDALTGEIVPAGTHAAVDLWRRFPVALLVREP